ncbi:MAG: cytochrome P450 [Acidimicrobiales bacterium]
MSNVLDADLATDHQANPVAQSFWVQPRERIEEILTAYRTERPVTFIPEPAPPPGMPLPQGPGTWLVTRHAEILHASKHPEIFSSASGITLLDAPPEFNEFFSSMIAMDDPRHARLRRIVSAGFTPRMLGQLEGTVQQVAAEIVDGIAERGEVDFIVDVAAELPLRIVCELMGLPASQYRYVFDRTNVILGASDPEYVADNENILEAIMSAGGDLAQLMHEVAKEKKGGDGTDLTSQLMNADLGEDTLSEADLASFFILLVVAGNETTRNAIGWGLTFLTENPEQRARWMADFDGLAPTAVEEIVRMGSPVTYMRRTVAQETELGDQKLSVGDKVCLMYLAANRDETVFDDPFRFDVGRNPNPHVGFGGPGPHFCLGAHLARREMTVMFRELFNRLPDIEAAGPPVQLMSSFIHGVKHLDARFTPVGPR